MNKPNPRPVLTLGRPPAKPVPVQQSAKKPDPPAVKATATATKPAKPVVTPEQKAALIAEERRVARIARATALRELTGYLMEAYPGAFPRPPAAPVPLAIGIHGAIHEAVRGKHSNNVLKVFLERWTDKARYLEALAAGEPRRNLDGTLAGEPTEKHREVAKEKTRRPAEGEVALASG